MFGELKPGVFFLLLLAGTVFGLSSCSEEPQRQPNILFLISDDQSFAHTSVAGCSFVNTPGFDRIANEGILFTNAIAASPGCSPSRAAILTGKYPWQIAEAGTHASYFPLEYKVFPDILEEAGYFVGYTGKGWAPGDYKGSGRKRNPAGNLYDNLQLQPPYEHISTNDYSGNFKDFYSKKGENQPFYFWMGAHEPHRDFQQGIWDLENKDPADVVLPLFLPDVPEIREDVLDYGVEIEWFDKHVVSVLNFLEEKGELDNTIIAISSDNGMAFPRAKANCFEYGVHVPLAIRWGSISHPGRKVINVVSLIDLTPTFLEAAGIENLESYSFSGKSLRDILLSNGPGKNAEEARYVFSSRERHSYSRHNNAGYPQRAVRTKKFLYIKNYHPERWPAGAPAAMHRDENPAEDAFYDIDVSPSKSFLLDNRSGPLYKAFFNDAVGKRPGEELYDIINDPNCLQNLIDFPDYSDVKEELSNQLKEFCTKTGDPRETGKNPEIFESYPRLRGPMRKFPEPKQQ